MTIVTTCYSTGHAPARLRAFENRAVALCYSAHLAALTLKPCSAIGNAVTSKRAAAITRIGHDAWATGGDTGTAIGDTGIGDTGTGDTGTASNAHISVTHLRQRLPG